MPTVGSRGPDFTSQLHTMMAPPVSEGGRQMSRVMRALELHQNHLLPNIVPTHASSVNSPVDSQVEQTDQSHSHQSRSLNDIINSYRGTHP